MRRLRQTEAADIDDSLLDELERGRRFDDAMAKFDLATLEREVEPAEWFAGEIGPLAVSIQERCRA